MKKTNIKPGSFIKKAAHNVSGPLKIGNMGVTIGINVFLDVSGGIIIGDYSQISEGTRIYTHRHLWKSSRELRHKLQEIETVPLVIGCDVFIGHGSTLICVEEIGEGAMIGTMSVVTKSIPPYEIWAGNPAKKVGERG